MNGAVLVIAMAPLPIAMASRVLLVAIDLRCEARRELALDAARRVPANLLRGATRTAVESAEGFLHPENRSGGSRSQATPSHASWHQSHSGVHRVLA